MNKVTDISVSVETINNKQVTVIRKEFDAEWVKAQLSMGVPVLGEVATNKGNKIIMIHCFTGEPPTFGAMADEHNGEPRAGGYASDIRHYVSRTDFLCTLTILPPLPRCPKPEDEALLYRYMSEGIEVYLRKQRSKRDTFPKDNVGVFFHYTMRTIPSILPDSEIFHAWAGNKRVEIAIEEGE